MKKNVSKQLLIALAIVAGVLLITTMIFTISYTMGQYSSYFNRTRKHTYHEIPSGENDGTKSFIVNTVPINNIDLCLTEYCIQAAEHLRKKMNESVDPCENFYEFACGSWIKNTEIPTNSIIMSSMDNLSIKLNNAIVDLLSSSLLNETIESQAISNARRLYNSCVNEDGIETDGYNVMDHVINEEFSVPSFLSSFTPEQSSFDLSSLLLKSNQYNDFPFYYVQTTIDYDRIDAMRYRIRISPAQHHDDQYRSFLSEDLLNTGFTQYSPLTLVNHQSRASADDIALTEFEKYISQYLLILTVAYVPEDIVTTVKNLSQTINTTFDFSDYIRRLYLLGNVTLTDDDIVVIHKINYIRDISSIIAGQSLDTLSKYIRKHFIESQTFHLPKRFRSNLENQEETIFNTIYTEPRTSECAKYVNKNMGPAVSKLYIDKYYNKRAHNESMEMVENIRNAFIDIVEQSMWMDADSKQRTIDKVQAILAKIGYPEYLDSDNVTKLESIYAEYEFNSSHIQNVLLLLQLRAKENFRRLRERVNRSEWTEHASVSMRAAYHIFFNEIVIPAGIFQPPFFHKDAPKYLNYGAIGSIVGHEIQHGLAKLGQHTDKNRENHALWSQETIDAYNKHSECIIEQYNNYTVNGKQTLDENIADNDGLRKAFYAYQKWVHGYNNIEKKLPGLTNYSAEQMFFINFGQLWCSKMIIKYANFQRLVDLHAPDQFRTNGPTSNFAEFDRAFNCKPGQGNSRVNKCNMW